MLRFLPSFSFCFFFFFFSSRRRHTRFDCDWSSDVCSSDLGQVGSTLATPHNVLVTDANGNPVGNVTVTWAPASGGGSVSPTSSLTDVNGRSEEHTSELQSQSNIVCRLLLV